MTETFQVGDRVRMVRHEDNTNYTHRAGHEAVVLREKQVDGCIRVRYDDGGEHDFPKAIYAIDQDGNAAWWIAPEPACYRFILLPKETR